MNKLINSNKNFLIAAILIAGIGAGILGYWQSKKRTIPAPSVPLAPSVPSLSTPPASTPAVPTPTPPPEVWETYTNSELGFSIKYPQVVYGIYKCEPDEKIWTPVKIIEDKKSEITYIVEEYYYLAPYNGELNKYTGPCEKITNSLELIKKENANNEYIKNKPFLGWAILTRNIKNEKELNKFIKDNYGSGCLVEKKEPWKQQDGVYEIVIKGEDWDKGADLGTTTCSFGYPHKILYAPGKNKLMSVIFDQGECLFGTDYNYYDSGSYKCYDEDIINSFKFE